VIELRGPTNDVELFARALREVYGVPDASMVRLAGWPADDEAKPTRANILKAFQDLARDAQAGDWVVVFMAGHGSQQPSARATVDDEVDGLDEIFLPSDVRPAADGAKVPNALTDDEIFESVGAIRSKGANVWLVIDACHSGTMLRGGDEIVLRRLTPDQLGLRGAGVGRAGASRAESAAPAAGWTDGVAAFYGAQSFGSAPEMELPKGSTDARPQGLFTYLLVREMRRVGSTATYSELAQRVIAAYQAFPCFLTVPLAEGGLDRPVGGGDRVAEPQLLLEVTSGGARLNQGVLEDVEVGAQVEVVTDEAAPEPSGDAAVVPADASAKKDAPPARLEVVESGLYAAECRVISGKLPDAPATLRARVVSRPVGEFQIALAVVSPSGAALAGEAVPETLRALLEAEPKRYRLADPARADWRVVVDGQRIHLRAAEHAGVADLLDVDPARLRPTLDRIRRIETLRRVSGMFSKPDDQLDVWIERRLRGSTKAQRLQARDVLRPGDEVQVKLKKSGGRIYDVTVLYLDAAYRIQCLFPKAGRSGRLEPKADKDLELTGWITVTDDALGAESLWVVAMPRQESDPERTLHRLADDAITTRGVEEEQAARDVIEDLVQGTVVATRGLASPAPAKETATGSVFLVPTLTEWPALAAPKWGAAEPAALEDPLACLRGLPIAADADGCWEIRTSRMRGARDDVLLVGPASGPRAVLLDFDAAPKKEESTPDPARFEPEAAFLFLQDGRRLALYDVRNRGAFDLALLDSDGDATAESRWTKAAGEWILQKDVTTPWLSQSNLAFLGDDDRVDATARLSLLAGSPPR
jgi:hypothetical protein